MSAIERIPADYLLTMPRLPVLTWTAYVGTSKIGLSLNPLAPRKNHETHNKFVDFIADGEWDEDDNVVPMQFTYDEVTRMNANCVDAVELSTALGEKPPKDVLDLVIEVAQALVVVEQNALEALQTDVDSIMENFDNDWRNFNG